MVIREDLVTSAISFLQDPSVANAPLDKRIAFLQSKNLTQEEVDASLARAGNGETGQAPSQPNNYAYSQQRQPPPQQYGYPPPYQGGYWQPPPPEVPRRDWRDYFIMATVTSGLGYGAYILAKRYIVPLIAPPTPPQLEQDKTHIDTQFTKAFALIDQLTTDTAAIRTAEEARKTQLDTALEDITRVVDEMKIAARRRDEDSKRINDEVRGLHALVPKALKGQEEATDNRLRELNSELRSLKTLISNRMSGQGVSQAGVPRSAPSSASSMAPGSGMGAGVSGANMFGAQGTASTNGPANGTGLGSGEISTPSQQPPLQPETVKIPGEGGAQPERSAAASPMGRFGTRGGIPAWQMAAKKKEEEEKVKEKEKEAAGAEDSAASSSLVS